MKKHILCLGDSNTHGYCADPKDCADGGIRFNEEERWPCLLQKALGDDYLVIEEGLSGRTTVYDDPLFENMNTLSYLYSILMSHEPIDLLIIMLGTNDTKTRLATNSYGIALGLQRLVEKARTVDCWAGTPNILVVAPAPIEKGVETSLVADEMGSGAVERSQELAGKYRETAELLGLHFMDAAGCEINQVDFMHLTRRGHRQLADRFAALVPNLV